MTNALSKVLNKHGSLREPNYFIHFERTRLPNFQNDHDLLNKIEKKIIIT